MKVKYNDWRSDRNMTIAAAVGHAIEPQPYSYDGELDKMRQIEENTSSMLGRLIEELADSGKLSVAQLQNIIGFNYEVEA